MDSILKASSMTSSFDDKLLKENLNNDLDDENSTFKNVADIKNWISTKLTQLEENNQKLKEENKKVNEELMKLKERYIMKKSYTPEPSRRRYTKRSQYQNRYMYRGRTVMDSSSSSTSSSDLDEPPSKSIRNVRNKSNRNQTSRKYNLTSKSSSLDRKLSKMKKYNFDNNKKRGGNHHHHHRNGKDYLENFVSLNRGNTNDNNKTDTLDDDNNLPNNNKPPTPPLHRLPSWESRIYEIANNGIQSTLSTPVQHCKQLDFANFYNNKRSDEDDDDDEKQIFNSFGCRTLNKNQHDCPSSKFPLEKNNIIDIVNNYHHHQHQQQFVENLNNTFNTNVGSEKLKFIVLNDHLRQETQQQKHSQMLFKSSTTSSGNESDSTATNFDNNIHHHHHQYAGQQMSSMFFNHNNNELMATATATNVSSTSRHSGIHHHNLDVCRDSFEKLKITPKLFTNQPQQTISTTNELLFNNDNKLEKSGYLYKLSGKFKVWKKRWFILKDGQLYYFKRHNGDNNNGDPNKRSLALAKGKIQLDQNCSLIRSNKEYSFHLFQQKKNVHLRCDSLQSYNEWLLAIGQTLTISNILKLQDNQVPIIENYIIKVRFGHSIKCWAALYQHHLVYFNNPFEKIPLGYTSLKDSTLQQITSVTDIEDMALIYDDIKKDIHYSVSIHPKGNSEPIYLLFLSKQDFSLWYYHLKMAFAENNIPKTAFENLLTSLLNIESQTNSKEEFYSNDIWNNPLLTFSNQNISEPLISLYNDELKKEAFKLFKSINLFISVSIDPSAIDYHVTLVQNCLQVCLDTPELQPELYYQLIKQSSKPKINKDRLTRTPATSMNASKTFWCSPHSIFKCESGSSSPSIDQISTINDDPNTLASTDDNMKTIFLQCLQLLSITISIFLPQNQVLWLLKHHINRFKNENTEHGKYILYCERALTRILLNGPRKRIPSRMEVLSILQRNPYQHSMPHSIPVHFANNSYQVIGFDGSTTVREFIKLINQESGIRDNVYSGFALYSDDPIESDVEHLLDLSAKLADAISYWETTLRKYNPGKFVNTKIIKLTYKHRLCLRKHFKNETDKERLIWIYEINNEVINDRFPATYDLAIELMSLMMQIEYGNYKNYLQNNNNNNSVEQMIKQGLLRFLPKKYHENYTTELIETIGKRWSELDDRSILDCVRIYLNCTRKWNFCGAQLFQAKVFQNLKYDDLISLYLFKFFLKHSNVWIGIDEDSVVLLELVTFRPILNIPYKNLLNYGYHKQYFNITVDLDCINELMANNSQQNHFKRSQMNGKQQNGQGIAFTLSEWKTIQITTLISDYIEIKKQQYID